MRFMVMVPASKESEAGVLPDEKLLTEMMKPAQSSSARQHSPATPANANSSSSAPGRLGYTEDRYGNECQPLPRPGRSSPSSCKDMDTRLT